MRKRDWTWEELRAATIRYDFKDYDEKAVFNSVLWNGEWYDITFIQKKASCTLCEETRPSYAIVLTQCEFIYGEHYCRMASHWQATVRLLKVITKEEGNRLYKAIKATERKTKTNRTMYRMTEDIA